MKIRIILLLIVIRLSDAEEQKKNLTGTKGGNITLPGSVLERGYLSYGGNVIASVKNRELDKEEGIHNNRLQWNKTSGLFTLTDLQGNDSGIYKIESKKVEVFTTSYNLTVYDSVAPPAVHTLTVSSDSCSLLCDVDKAAEITLWWYKDQELVNQSSSAGSLLLTVTKQDFNSSYRCVAGNPAENKTLLVDVKTSCELGLTNRSSDSSTRHRWIIIGVSTLGAVAFVSLVAFLIRWKCFMNKKKTTTTERQGSVDSKSEVQYSEIHICADRNGQGGTSTNPPGPIDRSNLTTVYDQLEAHRMVLPDSDGNV